MRFAHVLQSGSPVFKMCTVVKRGYVSNVPMLDAACFKNSFSFTLGHGVEWGKYILCHNVWCL